MFAPDPGSFLRFAETCERIGATTSRLAKAAELNDYFASLGDEDLALGARYLAGYVFPLHDRRTTQVGHASLLTGILALYQADPDQLGRLLVERGDAGEAAFAVAAASGRVLKPSLSLKQVQAAFDRAAATRGTRARTHAITKLIACATPLETKYLVKLLAGDLRIGLKEGAVEDAIARGAGVKVERVQLANMLTGDIGETAVLARHRQLGTARMRPFHPVKFMLASPAADPADVASQMPQPFLVEDKFDGIRAQAHVLGDRVELYSRTLDEITASFPELVLPLARLASGREGLLVDGEIVPVRGKSILPFQELQKRLGRKTVSAAQLASVPVSLICYDVLYAGGEVLIERPLRERRRILESLPFDGERVQLSAAREFGDVAALEGEFAAARARGNEGLMVKDPASAYRPGRRGREWLKIKRALATLDVVVTAVEVGHGRRSRFLSDYTFAVRRSEDDPELLNIGKAYSGLTDDELERMSDWFRAHTLKEYAHGGVRLVEPTVVLEVTFDRIQPSSRHKSGYALRFPRILRIRTDKRPDEADTLDTVRRLAEGRSP